MPAPESPAASEPRRVATTVRFALWSARHRWLVLALWMVATIGVFVAGSTAGTRTQTAMGRGDELTEAARGFDVFNNAGAHDPGEQGWVVLTSNDGTITDQADRAAVAGIVTRLRAASATVAGSETAQPIFSSITSPLEAPPQAGLVSADQSSALIVGRISGETADVEGKVTALLPVLDELRAASPSLRLLALNTTLVNREVGELVTADLDGSLKLTLPITFLILLLAFGALVAAFVPIVLAVTSLLGAFGLIALYSQAVEPVSQYASQVVVLIGLAVAIDYSLFLVTRFRTELRAGRTTLKAVEVTSSTAGRAVFFSGLAVAISLCGLLMINNSIFRSIAISTIVVVLVSVIGSLTFLPATLAALGGRINALHIPYFGSDRGPEGAGLWTRLVGVAIRHPSIVTVACVAVLFAGALPATQLRLGSITIDGLPAEMQSVQAWQALADKWPQGTTLGVDTYVTHADRPDTKAAMQVFATRMSQLPGIGTAKPVEYSGDGSVAAVGFTLPGGANDQANWDLISRVRTEAVPAAFASLPDVNVYVSGDAAAARDQTDMFASQTPRVIAFVLFLSFLLLLVVFHSVVIPTVAILLTLLSAGVAFGVMQLVFVDGWFSGLLGITPSPIESWVPPMIFTILFGLSMDYQVFILTRIKEERDSGLDSVAAITAGIRATSSTVTSAAAIMVAVFLVFVSLHFVIIRQMGLGLAVAVLVDATVGRSLLLPSIMKLLGDRNWYMPRWLQWIPRITIEGEPVGVHEPTVTSAPARAPLQA